MNYLTHAEAKEVLEAQTPRLYASPDFFRLIGADTLAVAVMDKPIPILHDAWTHGSDKVKERMSRALNCGYLITTTISGDETQAEYITLNEQLDEKLPLSIKNAHEALQFPYYELYEQFFGEHAVKDENGFFVFQEGNPKWDELFQEGLSLMNRQYTNDLYGQYWDKEDLKARRKAGLPTKIKTKNTSFTRWVEACKDYNISVTNAYHDYLAICKERKELAEQWEKYEKSELERMKAELKQFKETTAQQKASQLAELTTRMNLALQTHKELKAQGKPKRENF